jgi:DNA-binding GntR family transcriptional regulator
MHTKDSLVTTAYQAIYRKIVTLEYAPGRQLGEKLLVTDLAIGRTPIREALRALEADMLVESQPKKGVIVRPVTLQNTRSVFSALEVLETGVATLSCRGNHEQACTAMQEANLQLSHAVETLNIFGIVDSNSAFHTAFASCSDNIYLTEALRKTRCEANRLAYLSFNNEISSEQPLRDHYANVITQHNEIINLVKTRDASGLQKMIQQHIIIFKQRIMHYLTS